MPNDPETFLCPDCGDPYPLTREGYLQRHDACPGVRWPLNRRPSSVHAIPTAPPGSGKKRK